MKKIRPAEVKDALNIAKAHANAWIYAYTGIINAEYLADRTNPSAVVEKRAPKFAEQIKNPPEGNFILVAVDDNDDAVGFASGGKVRDDHPELTADAELIAIYVDPSAHGKGYGKALMIAFAKEVQQRYNAKNFGVGVLQANKSVGFYEKMGGKVLFETTWKYPYGEIPEFFYGYEVESLLKNFD